MNGLDEFLDFKPDAARLDAQSKILFDYSYPLSKKAKTARLREEKFLI